MTDGPQPSMSGSPLAGVSPGEVSGVSLRGEPPDGPQWHHVAPSLATVRVITLALTLVVPLVAAVVVAVLVTSWVWWAVPAILVGGAVTAYVVVRQVPVITYAELPEELVIRHGRLLRTLASIPYGRLQYVDLQSGPLDRRFGLASLTMHTANPQSGGTIPGLLVADAEALRERLAARGESQRAGL